LTRDFESGVSSAICESITTELKQRRGGIQYHRAGF
jgi:hypothetical protein